MKANILLLPGDGVGPEIVSVAKLILDRVAMRFEHSFSYDSQLIGGIAIDETGDPLPAATRAAFGPADAVLLGAVGGPRWDDPKAAVRPEQGLLGMRKSLGLYANLRPVTAYAELLDSSPLRRERIEGVDMLIVRELTGGLYFGEPRGRQETAKGVKAIDTLEYTDYEVRRVVELAFRLAASRRKLVTSVDKANVLESSRLWREVATEVGAKHPDVRLEHQLVDSAAMRLVTAPLDFDVIVTENMFGDILSDEASVLVGSLGMLPSASMGDGSFGVYEPIHGSAPDIAGRGVANPIATILSAAMMLRISLKLESEATAVEAAVQVALAHGARTADLGGESPLSTVGMAEAVLAELEAGS
ncbi:MAG: 3-isopropylmalate dehydrogenase [Nannocystaceae bacterium]